MKAVGCCLALCWVAAGSLSVAQSAEAIQLENASSDPFHYTYRRADETAWGPPCELPAQQAQTLPAKGPLVVSYWTDKPRFTTLQPGRTYRIQDVRRGELLPAETVRRIPAAETPLRPQPPPSGVEPAQATAPRKAPERGPGGESLRIVHVLAVADNTYRRVVDNWEQRIQRGLADASDYFEANFRIRFQLDRIQAWDYRGVAHGLEGRLRDLLAISPGDSDLVVAFVGFGEYQTVGEAAYRTGLLGMGMSFSRHVMVAGDDHFHRNRDKFVLTHELAHVFGAFHVDNPKSLMFPIHTGVPTEVLAQGTFELEPPLREVILAARDLDFRRGVESLDADTRRKIETLCRAHRHPREYRMPTPITLAHIFRELRQNACGDLGRPPDDPSNAAQSPAQDEVLGRGEWARVTTEQTLLQVADSTLARLGFGELVEVVEQQGDWVRVVAGHGGVQGWAQAKDLIGDAPQGQLREGQVLTTIWEVDLKAGERLLITLPPGIEVTVRQVENARVEVYAAKQDVAEYPGAKLVFQPAVEGWVRRDHIARSTTAVMILQ